VKAPQSARRARRMGVRRARRREAGRGGDCMERVDLERL
jgi:hypothetical protein